MKTENQPQTTTQSPKVANYSLWGRAWIRLKRHRLARGAMFVFSIIFLTAIFVPYIAPYAYDEIDWSFIQSAPSWDNRHWFGTDSSGRDLFVRVLYGTRVSLATGFLASLVSLIIGVSYGAIAGYYGGHIDRIMMRVVDILYALPFIFLVILLSVIFGRNYILIFISIGMIEWLTMARIVRGQTISIVRKEFIEAAVSIGLKNYAIIFRHIIPNLLSTVVIYTTLTIPQIILIESFISFLGLGVQEPLTSLGVLISEGTNVMETSPWILIFPASTLTITLFCLNFIGDGLRDALDPHDY